MHINPQKRNCIFGCEHSDSIQHYLQCPKMIHHIA